MSLPTNSLAWVCVGREGGREGGSERSGIKHVKKGTSENVERERERERERVPSNSPKRQWFQWHGRRIHTTVRRASDTERDGGPGGRR